MSMKAATVTELKKALQNLEQPDVVQLCLKLAKYKVDNKELLTYLIFESEDENSFILSVKSELENRFDLINYDTVYYTKKGLRKTLRYLDKFIRYSGIKETEVILRMHFLELIHEHNIPFQTSKVLTNLFNRQIDKIEKAINTLHEDLQYDYNRLLTELIG